MRTESTEAIEWTADSIRDLFRNSADFKMEKYAFGNETGEQRVYLMYAEGLADTRSMNQYVLPRLESMLSLSPFDCEFNKTLELDRIERPQDIVLKVFSGQLVIYFENDNRVFSLNIANPPVRSPEESNAEISIKGPRDGFVEDVTTNVALVRRRLRTASLCHESFTLGRRSQSRAALLYMEDIIDPRLVDEARTRLRHIDMDAVFGTSQLEKILSDYSPSLFPLLDYSGRPDYVADCLVHGRFAILADGAPTAIIGPANLTLLLKSPEDLYFPYFFVALGMLLRLLGLLIALLLPGFWIALGSFNMEQLPFPLLATIVLSRIGLPLPGPLESFLMVGMFELFREAGERLPKAVGQTVAVVGGIVVGDAAIRAGLASTTLIVVAAITAVASYTLVNQSLVGTVSVIRLFTMACASVLGMYGFILAVIAIVLYLSNLKSFGIPYLSPLSPLTWKDVAGALIRKPWFKSGARPGFLHPTDKTRNGGNAQ
ncbi:spore germination protein [Cohnella candidum]|uniref:Spore germination protein n=1 Tax=Cohnella candidum TaxID=2674991 RepID=A0A3G3JWS9_9BACL|nr:spore germination protein [Cohnella candidum]AYQ72317.1 spore germination protein [Cohnella candidum]